MSEPTLLEKARLAKAGRGPKSTLDEAQLRDLAVEFISGKLNVSMIAAATGKRNTAVYSLCFNAVRRAIVAGVMRIEVTK